MVKLVGVCVQPTQLGFLARLRRPASCALSNMSFLIRKVVRLCGAPLLEVPGAPEATWKGFRFPRRKDAPSPTDLPLQAEVSKNSGLSSLIARKENFDEPGNSIRVNEFSCPTADQALSPVTFLDGTDIRMRDKTL